MSNLFEKITAQKEVLSMMNCYGSQIKLLTATESTITRDKYGSIISRPSSFILLYAMPILFSPTRKDLEKAGIAENTDVIVYVSKLEFNRKNLDVNTLDSIKQHVIINKVEYIIKEKALISQFGDDFLYVTIGLMRK